MIHTKTTAHANALTHYLAEYRRVAKDLIGAGEKQLQTLRQVAVNQFSELGFPTLKHPNWRHTSLIPLLQKPFFAVSPVVNVKLIDALKPAIGDGDNRLVFVNGFFSSSLSKIAVLPPHATINHLADIIEHHPECLPTHWEKSAFCEKNSFTSLNTLFMQDGAYIYLPPHTKLCAPIELVFVTYGEQNFVPIRNIIMVQENSQVIVVEKYISLADEENSYFTNSVTECFLAAQSGIEHYKLLEESKNAMHIGNIIVQQQESSRFSAYSLALTGALIRSDVRVQLCQAHAQCHLKSLYYARENQHIDQQTTVDHLSPETQSTAFYKGIVDDHACGVFNGKLIVREKAVKSKAQQLNKNLLLSPSAEIYTKPQLEIFVDDIQCMHGASTGQLDETAIFYLRARGLSAEDARTLLIKAFIHDVIQQMPLLSTYPFLSHSVKNLLTLDYVSV